jgi:anti-sigma28 factor (negative regulator of flagellin synthesis)
MSTQQERAAKARAEKLAEIKQQVRAGSLVIREMTPAERAKYPKPDPPKDSRRRS